MIAAAGAAAGFALSTSLQHHAVDRAPETLGTHRLLAHLMARPWWLAGQLLAVVSFALHALALHLGVLLVVQPVVVSGIVLAVPVRAALSRRLPSRGELGTVTLTAAGLALFLVAAQPSAGHPAAGDWVALGLVVLGVTLAAVATRDGARSTSSTHAATMFGSAAGILFGLVAGLVKLTISTVGDQAPQGAGALLVAVLTSWSAWGVVAVGLSGVTLNQRAYRVAPLSASMPLLNMVNVLVALVFGFVVFGETISHSPAALAGQLVALACIAVGLRRLARSDVLDDA